MSSLKGVDVSVLDFIDILQEECRYTKDDAKELVLNKINEEIGKRKPYIERTIAEKLRFMRLEDLLIIRKEVQRV